MKRLALVLAIVLASGAVQPQGYGGSATKNQGKGAATRSPYRIVATGYQFNPSKIQVRRGQLVVVTLTNQSTHRHNITFQMTGKQYSLPNNLMKGQSGTLQFTAPMKAGQYGFYCPVGDHAARGMRGTLVVK